MARKRHEMGCSGTTDIFTEGKLVFNAIFAIFPLAEANLRRRLLQAAAERACQAKAVCLQDEVATLPVLRMSNSPLPHTAAAFLPQSRDGKWLALICAATATVAGYLTFCWSADERRSQELESAYIQKHLCVVADVRGRVPYAYRCDLPTHGESVSAVALAQRAAATK